MLVDGNNFIRHHLKNDKLFSAGKIGATEIKILYSYKVLKYPEEHSLNEGFINSGIFPKNTDTFNSFCQIFLDSIKSLDIAPRWNGLVKQFEIDLFNELAPNCYDVPMRSLEPYYWDKPWTEFLKDKNVLVVSPFAKSIENQFKKLNLIWNNKIQNNFNLKIIKFPFSIGISDEMKQWKNYIECLEYFKEKISKENFDFCIIGAGAYSLPLCQYVKSLKKSSIHLGGATQVLFGIKGNRWDSHPIISKFFNEHWIRPLKNEVPSNHKINEDGAYW